MKLRTCSECGGPRRSLTQEVCSRCRKNPHDVCSCGAPKLAASTICIRCHARDAVRGRWQNHVAGSYCPSCGKSKKYRSHLCRSCYRTTMF